MKEKERQAQPGVSDLYTCDSRTLVVGDAELSPIE